MRFRYSIPLIATVLLSFFLRFFILDQVPNSISADEAAYGYNAYSILKTGKDEFWQKLPLTFRSFDDYKHPVFVYLLVPFIKIFGLSEFTIRLPSVIIGTLTTLIFYLLSAVLVKNRKIALITAFFSSISPWLIQYSRVSLEMQTALFLSLTGAYLYLRNQKNLWIDILAGLSFSLAFWSYYSNKVWVLLFLPILIVFRKKIDRRLILGGFIFILLLVPYVRLYFSSNILLRPYGLSVFSEEEKNQDALLILKDNNFGGKLIHNRRLTPINQAVNGYLRILNPEILFSQNRYNQIPITRLFYLWQLPFLIRGIYYLIKIKRLNWFIITWILIGLIPAAITYLPPFDRRILIVSYPFFLLMSIACSKFLQSKKYLLFPMMSLFIIPLYFYLHQYFIHGQNTAVELWGNGMRDLVRQVSKEKNNYKQVIVSIKLNQPLTFFLFYEKYSPQKYLNEGGTISGGYLDERNKFDKYQFKNITKDSLSLNTLYVWEASEYQPCLEEKYTIFRSDKTALGKIGIYKPGLAECKKWLEI